MVRINTAFQEDILEEIDSIAKEEGKSRSALLREVAKKLIREHQQGTEKEAVPRRIF